MSIQDVLAHQSGLITRRQAVAGGIAPHTVDRYVRERRWQPVLPQVYRTGPPDPGEALRAAVLWAGPDAVLTGLGAAWWHGLVRQPPVLVRVAVPGPRRPYDRAGLSVRSRPIPSADVTVLRGLRVTTRPVTTLDAAVELGRAGVELLERSGVRLADLRAAADRLTGLPGSATAALLLRDLQHRALAGDIAVGAHPRRRT